MKKCLALSVLALTTAVHGAGQPDLQGVWNFSSDVPLERPAAAADRKMFTREELAARKAAKDKAFEMISKAVPVEAVALTWLDYAGQVEDLRTSLITYPENGRLPSLVNGIRRVPGAAEIFAALVESKGLPPPELVSAILTPGSYDGPEDFGAQERCLFSGTTPLIPDFSSNFLQIVQSKDTIALVTEYSRRIVTLDGRPHASGNLRSWTGDSRGRWDGETLVVETKNFNRRTRSFAGAGNSLEKVVTERFTRASKDVLQYEATVVDPKTFQDRVMIAFPMARAGARIYETACHEGNYSMSNMLSAARAADAAAGTH